MVLPGRRAQAASLVPEDIVLNVCGNGKEINEYVGERRKQNAH